MSFEIKKTDEAVDALVYKAIIENVKENIKSGKGSKTTYKEVSNKVQKYLGLETNSNGEDYFVHWNNKLAHSLGRISTDCIERNLPPITILVEKEKEEISGDGFIAFQDKLRQSSFQTAWNNLKSSADFKEIIDFIQDIVATSYGLK